MRSIKRVGAISTPGVVTALVMVTVGLLALTGCGRQGYVPASLKEHPLTAKPDQVPIKGNPAPRPAVPSDEPSGKPSTEPGTSKGSLRKVVVQCMTLEIAIPEDWAATKDGSATVFTVPKEVGGGTLRVAGEFLDGANRITDMDKLTEKLREGDEEAPSENLGQGILKVTSKSENSSKIRLGKTTADEQTEIVTLNYIYNGGGDPSAMLTLQESFAKTARFTNVGTCEF